MARTFVAALPRLGSGSTLKLSTMRENLTRHMTGGAVNVTDTGRLLFGRRGARGQRRGRGLSSGIAVGVS